MKTYYIVCFKLTRFFVFTYLLLFTFPAMASHVVGSDIVYQGTSNPNVYSVTLKVYRDCTGLQMCANCPAGISPTCAIGLTITGAAIPAGSGLPASTCAGTGFGTQNLSVVTGSSGFDVIQLCSTEKTVCSNCGSRTPGSFTPGIEIYTFTGTINLSSIPSTCCLINIGYSTCCRNSTITTLLNPSSHPFYTEAFINRCLTVPNSSPTFNTDPIFIMCAGRDFNYNIGASDPDGDSLSYAFGPCLTAPGTPAPYTSQFSITVPFPYLGAPSQSPPGVYPIGININPTNGDIFFRPIGSFVANLVIMVRQWRNIGGTPMLVGMTRRDIQVYSTPCGPNLAPIIKTYDSSGVIHANTPHYNRTAFAGKPLCFIVSAPDTSNKADTTDLTLFLPAQLQNKGATVTKLYNPILRGINGPRYDSLRFCWTPPITLWNKQPYILAVQSADRICPMPARIIQSFKITLKNYNILPEKLIFCPGGGSLLSFPDSAGFTVKWQKDGILLPGAVSGSYYAWQAGNYKAILYIGALASDSSPAINLSIKNPTLAITTPNTAASFCLGGSATLFASQVTGAKYTWLRNNVGISNLDSTKLKVSLAGSYQLILTDLIGCKDTSDMVVVSSFQKKFATLSAIGSARICSYDSVGLQVNSTPNGKLRWLKNGVPTADTTSLIIYAKQANAYSVILSDSTGCKDTTLVISVTINLLSTPIISPNANASFCIGKSVLLSTPLVAGLTYKWTLDNNDINGATSHTYEANLPGQYRVKIGDSTNCTFTSSPVSVLQNPKPIAFTIIGQEIGLVTNQTYTYSLPPQNGVSVNWVLNPGTIISGQGTDSVQVSWSNIGTAKLYAILKNAYNCEDTTKLNLTVGVSGLITNSKSVEFSLMPNPASKEIVINCPALATSVPVLIRITDVAGKLVLETTETGSRSITLPVHQLKNGTYFIWISCGNTVGNLKFIKN
ncbi:MAG: T9SS type A sorting domain-containing protein [bacterium]|nr:T9SS type A sorting domain-containing protein [bacterium]